MNRYSALFLTFSLFSCAVVAQNQAPSSPLPVTKPAATSAESPEKREFQKLEDTWSDAINLRDQYGMELVLSPLFVDVSSNGDITTRNQQLAELITRDDKMLNIDQHVITVRLLGDIAVANGIYRLRHKAGSTPVDEKGVFTHVFERTRGGWVCINAQRTLVRADNSTSAKPKKQSSAEMPFHIPLFSKN